MNSKLGVITTIWILFMYWKRVELAKIRCFRCETLKPFFSKQGRDSYYHGILAATEYLCHIVKLMLWKWHWFVFSYKRTFDSFACPDKGLKNLLTYGNEILIKCGNGYVLCCYTNIKSEQPLWVFFLVNSFIIFFKLVKSPVFT